MGHLSLAMCTYYVMLSFAYRHPSMFITMINPGSAIYEKSVYVKYTLNTEIFLDPSCGGSFGSCLDCVIPGAQVTAGLGLFSSLKL